MLSLVYMEPFLHDGGEGDELAEVFGLVVIQVDAELGHDRDPF